VGHRVVAAFDWDGTLTRRDTLVPYLLELCGAPALVAAATRTAPWLLAAGTGLGSRDRAKARLLRPLLAGRPAAAARAVGEAYAARVVRAGLRRRVADRLAWHREQGHEVVLVSASLDVYLEPAARRLGADALLCTRLEVGAGGRLTGELAGGNCRGDAKARRLLGWLGATGEELPPGVDLWAYGDSPGDAAMLALASRPANLHRGLRRRRLPPLS
jgi:phosphatidylglycerophosphatase C